MLLFQHIKNIRSVLLLSGLILSVILFLGVVFYSEEGRTSAARALWYTTHQESIVTFLKPQDAKLYLDIGAYYFGGGVYDLQKAREYFNKAHTLDSELLNLHYEIARLDFIQNRLDNALQEINEEIYLHSENRYSLYVRALIYGYRNNPGDLDLAAEDFKNFLIFKPESWAGHNDLAWIYFTKGDYVAARDTAIAGIEAGNEHNPWLHNSLGVALLGMGYPRDAKSHFLLALDLFKKMSPKDWGRAYPGNNPRAYKKGYESVIAVIERNISLIDEGKAASIPGDKSSSLQLREVLQ